MKSLRRLRYSPSLLLAGLLALCAGAVRAQTTQTAAAPPSPALSAVDAFVIRPGDYLKVQVWPDSSLGGEFLVEGDGLVQLPLVGPVKVGGARLIDVREQLRQTYRSAVKEPTVAVVPLVHVSVLGAVKQPGVFPIGATQTLFDVISVAGGFADNARPDAVRILRDGQVITVNLKRTFKGGAADQVALQSGDRIYVPAASRIRLLDIFYVAQTAVLVVTLLARR